MTTVTAQRSEFVQELDEKFLELWSHRFDFIFAGHPAPNEKPNWQTESKHPLSDRLILQGAYLYGVRFGSETQYAMLDIDAGSPYHPKADAQAIDRITAALEPLGLVRHLMVTSSYSAGLHLYFPFPRSLPTWKVGLAVTALLENAGFKVAAGLLEVFPNTKGYSFDDNISLYNGHRLPLQEPGSYLLNTELQPTFSSGATFVEQWQHCSDGNDINGKLLATIIKQARRKRYGRISVSAQKFLSDLNAEIELGWTGTGQTNRLLGRITLRSYIFGHVINGGKPLEGQALIDEIVSIAQSLPGFYDYCRHQHELEDRAAAWAKCIENSHYYHFGNKDGKFKARKEASPGFDASTEQLSWNEQRSQSTREKIRQAIAELLETDQLPTTATERFRLLTGYGIGGGSLYRHRDLWHPEHLWKSPPDPPNTSEGSQLDCIEASNWHNPTSLLSPTDGNLPHDKHFSDSTSLDSGGMVGNPLPGKVSPDLPPADPPTGVEWVQQALVDSKEHLEAYEQAAKAAHREVQQAKEEALLEAHLEKMQRFLSSGDPILVAEAQAQAEQHHPKLLRREKPIQDRAEVTSAIASRLNRLACSPSKVGDSLSILLGKSSVTKLNNKPLVRWRRRLLDQPGSNSSSNERSS